MERRRRIRPHPHSQTRAAGKCDGGRLMKAGGSTLYASEDMHRRLRPRQHRLRYRVFYPLLDLDETDQPAPSLRLFSDNRFHIFSHTDHDAEGPLIVARLIAARHPLTDASLLRAFLLYPLMTIKVIAAIHWEAVLLWLKGIRLQHRPLPPDRDVTVGEANLTKVQENS